MTDRLEEIRKRRAVISCDGPWQWREMKNSKEFANGEYLHGFRLSGTEEKYNVRILLADSVQNDDARFIAHAPDDIDYLLNEIDNMQEYVDELKEEIRKWRNEHYKRRKEQYPSWPHSRSDHP